jgi:hypothetical protein
MSNYLETMERLDTYSNDTNTTTVEECNIVGIGSITVPRKKDLSVKNDGSNNDGSETNEEEGESTDRNHSNDDFAICSGKVPSTEFIATYLVLSEEKKNGSVDMSNSIRMNCCNR